MECGILGDSEGVRSWTLACPETSSVDHAFIADRTNIPKINTEPGVLLCLTTRTCRRIHPHIRSVGKYMKAMDIVQFLGTPEMLERLRRKTLISLKTAQRWLKRHHYRYTKEPSGQFVDGHERVDVRIIETRHSCLHSRTWKRGQGSG